MKAAPHIAPRSSHQENHSGRYVGPVTERRVTHLPAPAEREPVPDNAIVNPSDNPWIIYQGLSNSAVKVARWVPE